MRADFRSDTTDTSDTTYGIEAAPPVGSERHGQWRPAAVCTFVYVALAMLEFGHFGSLGPGHMSGIGSPDVIVQVWWLAWAAYALTHGHNLFFTTWLNYPAGQNFGDQGSLLALGGILLPITKVFGPVVAWNIAVRSALAGSAISMCFVLRRWTTWWPAAFVGGLLYGFSAYISWYAGEVYLFLVFVPLPPLILLVLHEILVRQRWKAPTAGTVLALLCTVQFFISTEVLVGTVMMGGIASVLYVLVSHRALARRWRYVGTAFACTVLVGAVFLIYPVVVTFGGPQHVNGSPASPAQQLPADLLSSVVPNGEWLGPKPVFWGSSLAYGGGLYLGVPLIVGLLSFAVFLRKRKAILFMGAMALISYILSLLSPLRVNKHLTGIPLPSALFAHLPVIQGLSAARLSLFTSLFSAGTFAIGIDELWRRLSRRQRFAWLSPTASKVIGAIGVAVLCGLVIMTLVPRTTISTSATEVPSFFSSPAVDKIPAGSVVLTYPYMDSESNIFYWALHPARSAMIDQAVANMRFRLIGGYGWFPRSTGHFGTVTPAALEPQSVQAFFDAAFGGTLKQRALLTKSNLTRDLRVFFRRYDVQTVIIVNQVEDWRTVVQQVSAAIGSPSRSGGVILWTHVRQVAAHAPFSQRISKSRSALPARAEAASPSHSLVAPKIGLSALKWGA